MSSKESKKYNRLRDLAVKAFERIGFSVETDKKVGKVYLDILAHKDDSVVICELKSVSPIDVGDFMNVEFFRGSLPSKYRDKHVSTCIIASGAATVTGSAAATKDAWGVAVIAGSSDAIEKQIEETWGPYSESTPQSLPR